MAKNIEMNNLNSDGSYEVVYPKTKQELVIDLLNDDTKELIGLNKDDTADDAFKALYLANVLNGKCMVSLTLLGNGSVPINGVEVKSTSLVDAKGTVLESQYTNGEGKVNCFFSKANPVLTVSGYGDIQDASFTLDAPLLGEMYEQSPLTLTLVNFKKYTSSSNVKFSSNVTRVDVTTVGGGGGGGGGHGGNYEGIGCGGGGGGGYCAVEEDVAFTVNTSYALIIGSGGSAGAYGKAGGNGGSSSFLGISANGGTGGARGNKDADDTHGIGGAGNGNGATYGDNYNEVGSAAVAGSVAGYSSFTSTVNYGGGGGSGDFNNNNKYYTGAGYGGNGFKYGTAAVAGTNGYGGGGGAGGCKNVKTDAVEGAAGGSGCVAIRMHLNKS